MGKPLEEPIRFAFSLEDVSREIKPVPLKLPFPAGKTYQVMQGNNTDFTHNPG